MKNCERREWFAIQQIDFLMDEFLLNTLFSINDLISESVVVVELEYLGSSNERRGKQIHSCVWAGCLCHFFIA